MYQKLVLNCLWGPCVQNRVLVQRNMPLLCETLYRVHADVPPPLFCWSLAPHPLPSACHRDSREWIHSKRSQRSLLLNWTRHELGPAAGFMHQKHEQFLLAALLCVSWRLLWSTSILLYRSIHLILVCVLYLLLKILSNRDCEQNVVKCFVILQDECLGGGGGVEWNFGWNHWMNWLCLREGTSNMSPGWSDDTGDNRKLLCRHANKAKLLKM